MKRKSLNIKAARSSKTVAYAQCCGMMTVVRSKKFGWHVVALSGEPDEPAYFIVEVRGLIYITDGVAIWRCGLSYNSGPSDRRPFLMSDDLAPRFSFMYCGDIKCHVRILEKQKAIPEATVVDILAAARKYASKYFNNKT